VTARTWEASLRLALGARPWLVSGGLVKEAAVQLGAGTALGWAIFYLSRRTLSGVLFQTPAIDPSIVAAASVGMLLFGLSAALWQARRLASVSPALGMRGQELRDQ
jgi:ABC-type antimicrobial peptide transport system permease subunit